MATLEQLEEMEACLSMRIRSLESQMQEDKMEAQQHRRDKTKAMEFYTYYKSRVKTRDKYIIMRTNLTMQMEAMQQNMEAIDLARQFKLASSVQEELLQKVNAQDIDAVLDILREQIVTSEEVQISLAGELVVQDTDELEAWLDNDAEITLPSVPQFFVDNKVEKRHATAAVVPG